MALHRKPSHLCSATMMDNDPMSKPLMRVRQGALIAGVCGGIAKWLGLDPTIVRVLYAALTLLSAAFPGIIIYILLWILMPREPE
jgi:phage shock protein C